MTEPTVAPSLPDGIHRFLSDAGWEESTIDPLAGDASFRRYFRIKSGDRKAMLMYAPPPEEDPKPFLHVAQWLADNDMRAPAIFASDPVQGWVLIEDFGDDRMRDWLDTNPEREEQTYRAAVDALALLHRKPAGPFPPYDMETYLREAELFTQWYCPMMGLEVDREGYLDAWREALQPLLDRQGSGVTVLRDYHAENIMLLESGKQGLIDFQDALVGHPAYDLVSLLQDARRDVSPELEAAMLEAYRGAASPADNFDADYAILGGQRNAKIVGIFARLWKRDGKGRYIAMIPRVWGAMERDLADPALAPVARWFEANIPQNIRDDRGGELM